jgi:hypothetical protein
VVHPEVRGEIPDSHVGETVVLGVDSKDRNDDGKTKITQQDELGILGFIQRAVWVEVVDTGEVTIDLSSSTAFMLSLVIVVASDIGKQVQWPSAKLLQD